MSDLVIALTVLAWLAYLAGRLLRRTLPELIVFLGAGALMGPEVLGLLDAQDLGRLEGVIQLALAVLMFTVGERVSVRALRRARWVGLAGLVQYLICAALVFAVARWVGATNNVAVLLAALAGAGAPMTVASVVASTRGRSPYGEALIGVHAVGDALAAVAFAAALPIVEELLHPGTSLASAGIRFGWVALGTVALGSFFGWVVARFGPGIESSGELLLFILVHVLVVASASAALGLSLPLAALVMGAVAASLGPSDAAQRTFVAVRQVEQPLYLLFFALAGASIHFSALPALGGVGLAYLLARTAGKVAGGWLVGIAGNIPGRSSLRLGMDLMPQAGVAVGLAVLAAESLPGTGGHVAAVVLGSVVLFELVGPLLVARGLRSEPPMPTVPEDGVGPIDDRLPTSILLASEVRTTAPAWLVDWFARTGASLTVLRHPDEEGTGELRAVEDLARDRGIPVRSASLSGETFAGSVIRTAREVDADLVVLVVLPRAPDRLAMRLTLLPQERIARHLSCPIVLVPVEEPVGEPSGRLSKLLRGLP